MKLSILSACLVFSFVGLMCAEEPLDVSMIQLIATPEKFNGKIVRVFGYLHLEFEGDGLYLHKDDEREGLTRNGIWFDRSPEVEATPKRFTDHYVLVEGRFDAQGHGHMGLWSGTITGITRVMTWPPKPQPLQRAR
jgi:hypothetical protein